RRQSARDAAAVRAHRRRRVSPARVCALVQRPGAPPACMQGAHGEWRRRPRARSAAGHRARPARRKARDVAGPLVRRARRTGTPGGGVSRDRDVDALHEGARGADRGARLRSGGRAMSDEPPWRDVDTRVGYDRWATTYDDEGNPLLALEEPEADHALGDVAGLELLDVGTGTGRHALRLAARGAHVTAIDFSENMLAKARAKRGADRVRFENHDVTERLPYADASFDRVLSALVLEHVPDVAAFLRELGRVTRPDGRIVITAMHPAMFLRGVSARVRDDGTGEFLRRRPYVMQLSDYVMGARDADLEIISLTERAPDEALAARVPRAAKYLGWPMLFVM